MGKRASLSGNIAKPDAKKAAEVAQKLTGAQATGASEPDTELSETVSYNLPVDLIDLYRDLARARHIKDQAERRAAKRAGKPFQGQARESASAAVREALLAYRPQIEAELKALSKE